MKKVFLCTPLSQNNKDACIHRTMRMGEAVLREYGLLPVVPHMTASFLDLTLQEDLMLYRNAAKELLWLCDEMWVVGDPDSFMASQIEIAKALNIRTRYLDEAAFHRKEKKHE